MDWSERKLTPRFGAELVGARIEPDMQSERQAIYDAVMTHGLVLLSGQSLSDDDIDAFASSLGPVMPAGQFSDMPKGKAMPITNLGADGKTLPADDWYVRAMKPNELWHVDLSFVRPRASVSMLYGRVVTRAGGNTEFCDLRLLCEDLPAEERTYLATLTAWHDVSHARRSYGFNEMNDAELGGYPPVPRPLLSRHESGRDTLLLASHICELSGHDREASAVLTRALTARATAPDYVYSHKWRVGDLLLWDNRCVMHRATPFASDDPRDLRAVRLADVTDMPEASVAA